MNTYEKLIQLEKEMNGIIVERNEATRGLLMALLSRQHLFTVGPPGTAKSEMIRLLASAIKGSNAIEIKKFDIMMTRFTTPEEVVGPIKFSALKQDKYERCIEGYMP
ncbi:MAG: AAA family ATPase, partial [Candidatus Aenigmarchaeota archaeon]|nr:AAA family ATPase [Candidatus Aenigmarchaeota archaeon]